MVVSGRGASLPRGLVSVMAEEPSSGIDQVRAMLANGAKSGIGETLDFALVEVEHGRVVFEGRPDRRAYNPLGSVHGGYAATLLDSACAIATHTTLGPNRGHTTLELKVSYLRALTADSGAVRATGRVISAGKRVAFAEAELRDEQDRLCASATSTLLVFDAEPRSRGAFQG